MVEPQQLILGVARCGLCCVGLVAVLSVGCTPNANPSAAGSGAVQNAGTTGGSAAAKAGVASAGVGAVNAGAAAHAGAMGTAGQGDPSIAGARAGAGGRAGNAGFGAAGLAAIGGATAAGQSGAASAGAGGTSGNHLPVPSAGCGKSGRPNGGVVTVMGSHIYSFPPSYDGSKPLPLIMAFHAAGNSNDQLRNITKGSALESHFVMAFPKSQGSGWVLGTDSARIDARYDDLLQNYCVDKSRVFATGHSSGAQLIVQLMCRSDDRYFAIAPVASSAYCPKWNKPIPALVIHGLDDRERANTNQDADGKKDLAPYLSSNVCGMSSLPHDQAGCSSAGTQVNPGCVEYQGCAQSTIWCHHDDPQYSNTNHGWPCFANVAIDEFFTSQL
jgi:polyhydroxybutyrate depolymerase